MNTREKYTVKLKNQLDELNLKMNALESSAKEARADARAKYQEEMDKLHLQSQAAMTKLEELKTVSEDAWDTAVAEMEKVRDAFKHSFHYFTAQF
jgi:hypothetical protein